ncbi:MAG: pilus assembly protein PilM [Candidatus Margulisbacteria bacterium]|nr:pilus assembly protein PilM [Candidatus Margulisiibacteriota bacterium]
MLTARSMLGIDLRIASVKVVEIEKKDAGYVIKNSGMTEVPSQLIDKHPQLEEAKTAALRQLIAANNIKTREAVVIAAGPDTLVKLLSLSAMPDQEAADAIKWKFAEEIPYPIEEAILASYPLRKTGTEKVDYFAACISRKFFLETQAILNNAGLKLVGITVLPDALEELYRAEIGADEKITSIIYMGKRSTNISIFRRGGFEFNRELAIGGDNISRAMAGILVSPEGRVEVTPEEAEKIKVEHGLPVDLETYPKLGEIPLTQLQAMVRPALEKMQSEISRTFEYYKGQSGEGAVSQIILTGGSSLTPNLKEFLSKGLGVPITTPLPFPKLDPRLSVAAGAALTGAQRLNLVPKNTKLEWKSLAKPYYLIVPFAGLLALIYLFFFLQALGLQKELASVNKKLDEYKPRLARLDAIERVSREEEKRKTTIRSFELNRSRLPNILETISRIIPDSVVLNNMSLTASDIVIRGTVFKKNEAAESILSRFVLGLSTSTVLEGVKLVQAAKNYDYSTEAFNFEIAGRIRLK